MKGFRITDILADDMSANERDVALLAMRVMQAKDGIDRQVSLLVYLGTVLRYASEAQFVSMALPEPLANITASWLKMFSMQELNMN